MVVKFEQDGHNFEQGHPVLAKGLNKVSRCWMGFQRWVGRQAGLSRKDSLSISFGKLVNKQAFQRSACQTSVLTSCPLLFERQHSMSWWGITSACRQVGLFESQAYQTGLSKTSLSTICLSKDPLGSRPSVPLSQTVTTLFHIGLFSQIHNMTTLGNLCSFAGWTILLSCFFACHFLDNQSWGLLFTCIFGALSTRNEYFWGKTSQKCDHSPGKLCPKCEHFPGKIGQKREYFPGKIRQKREHFPGKIVQNREHFPGKIGQNRQHFPGGDWAKTGALSRED